MDLRTLSLARFFRFDEPAFDLFQLPGNHASQLFLRVGSQSIGRYLNVSAIRY